MLEHIVEVLAQVERIMTESPWMNDYFGDMVCFFCGEEQPGHRDDCPYAALKALERQALRDVMGLIEAREVERE